MSSALVATTMIAFVVALATAIPTSTRPVNIPSPLPVGCRRDDGTEVEGLFPGGTTQNGCEYCDCDGNGRATCFFAECPAPRCADPQEGECCSTCPNGENCRTPSGKIIKAGETLTEDGMICSCSLADYYLMWWDVNPGDGPPADCSPQVCVMEDGTTIQVGQEWVSPNGCMHCTCDQANSQAICYTASCVLPPCVDAVTAPGECCPTCPNGPNCITESGQIFSEGEKVVEPNGMECSCSTSPANGPETTCSFPTTAPPSVCDTMEDGTPLAVGKEWKSVNGCKGCQCDSESGKAVCWVQDCAPVACANPVSTPGVCCHTCPNVKTCKLDSGEIITMGKILKKDGAVCKCRRKHSGLAAVCTPTTVLEKMLKRLKAKLQKKKGQLSEKGIRKLNRRINQLQRQLN